MAQMTWIALTVGLTVLVFIELNYWLNRRARPIAHLAEIYRAAETSLSGRAKRVRISFAGFAQWFLIGQLESKDGIILSLPRAGYSAEECRGVISAFERRCHDVQRHDDDSRFIATIAMRPMNSAQPNSVLVVRGTTIIRDALDIPTTVKVRWTFDY